MRKTKQRTEKEEKQGREIVEIFWTAKSNQNKPRDENKHGVYYNTQEQWGEKNRANFTLWDLLPSAFGNQFVLSRDMIRN